MRSLRFILILCVAVMLTTSVVVATTLVPPRHLGHLAQMSRAVVFAEAVESHVETIHGKPYTVTRFVLIDQVSGEPLQGVFETQEPGGVLGDAGLLIAGSPRFEDGDRYLLFLDDALTGRWRSQMLSYGLLRQVGETDLLQPLPEAMDLALLPRETGAPELVGVYWKSALLAHLEQVGRGVAPWNPDLVRVPQGLQQLLVPVFDAATAPSDCRFLGSSGFPARMFGFETGTTLTVSPTTPGQSGLTDGGVSAVQEGTAAWTNHAHSKIEYTIGSTISRNVTCSASSGLQQGAVVFDDPCNDIANLSSCSGTLAFGGLFFSSQGTHDGTTWWKGSNPFVVVNNGAECIGSANFKEMMTHELGHSIGFGHHTDNDATMRSFCCHFPRGADIAGADESCAAFAYHTFLDVPFDHSFWAFIEAIENAQVTAGCGAGNYCPGSPVDRGQMAVFLLKALEGSGFSPPSCASPVFSDVPCSHPFADWINELANRNITAGCGGGNYCPASSVTRQEMAVFLLKTLEGAGFVPPACNTPMFSDVPCSSPFAPWINELASRNITGGCGGGKYCPTDEVTRGQMAVFLTKTFSLPQPSL